MVRPDTSHFLFFIVATISAPWISNSVTAQDEKQQALAGEWLYVKDITKDRPVEKQGPPMSVRIKLRVEKDAVVWERPRGDERMTLDGAVIEKDNENGSITRYFGNWKNGALEYTLETIRLSDKKRVLKILRTFRVTADGLQITRSIDDGKNSLALYRNPDEIAMPTPAKARISDLKWLTGAWDGTTGTRSTEERWTPPKGGAMLGVSRTFRGDKMVAFEFLRIVEREEGLVYVAQPGGRPATEFVLTELKSNRAVFKNPRHDYPQRVVYELSKDGDLTANIGFAIGGEGRTFEFKRQEK